MRKAWTYKRRGKPGVYVHWYGDDGKQHSKRLPNKTLAEQYRQRLERRMNDDIFVDPEPLPWDTLVVEYVEFKRTVKRLAPGSLKSLSDTLANFRRLCGPVSSTKVNQKTVNSFVSARAEEGTAAATINKDLRQLRAFVRWSIKNRYMGEAARAIDWGDVRQKQVKRPVRALSIKEFAQVLHTALELYGLTWYVRVILAVASGLRQQDIERLQISDIHTDSCSLTTRSRKTGKSSGDRPIHPLAMKVLAEYITTLPEGQKRLFPDTYHHSKWDRIQEKAGVAVKYHDLRRTFASFILQAGFSTSVAQDLLEHATPILTHDVYAQLSPVYRNAVNSIPLDKVIEPEAPQSPGPCVASPARPPEYSGLPGPSENTAAHASDTATGPKRQP